MQNWDDLRYILAIAQHGTVSEAAKALHINQTTMSRRLRTIEDEASTRLFEKLKHGAVLTNAGEEMVAVAEEVSSLCNDLDARIGGLDSKLEGSLRVTSTHHLFTHWLADFGVFGRENPGIDLELISSFDLANLTQREADMAIRMAPTAPDHLIGRKYAKVAFAIYGSRSLVENYAPDARLEDLPWLAWDLSFGRWTDDWLAHHAPAAKVVLRVDTPAMLVQSLEASLGITILPCFAGDTNNKLCRVGEQGAGATDLWILTHPQLRASAKVRALTAFMRQLIERDRELLEGRVPAVHTPSA